MSGELTISMPESAAEWLRTGQRGISSNTIFSVMTGLPINWRGYPSDPADLMRCRLLLQQVPEWQVRITEMRGESREWAALVDHWDELCDLMDAEAPYWLEGRGSAPKTYARMKELTRGDQ